MIKFKELPINDDDVKAVATVMESKALGMGRTVAVLEEEFADFIGCDYAVALSSCTNSLFLALSFLKGGGDNRVGIPSMMVPLVANEILHAGYLPFFIDNVDWVGHRYQLVNTTIIDSAHEVTPMHNKFFDGKFVCYSFYPTKPICGADGGMICTNNADFADWFRKARWFGRSSGDTIAKNSWEYSIDFAGWKMNMSDIQAAIILTQLRKFFEVDKRRKKVLDKYNKNFSLKKTSKYLYRIKVKNRDDFIKYMRENNVECGVHFYPLHMMSAYRRIPTDGALERTEAVYKTTASLPYYDSLTEANVDYISELVIQWYKKMEDK